MKKVFVLIVLALISGSSCLSKTETESNVDSCLLGLNCSYVNFVINSTNFEANLLKFYNKSILEFKSDSIKYFTALKDFYKSDDNLIKHLLKYKNFEQNHDCSWLDGSLPTNNPFSSYIDFDMNAMINNSYFAGLILIFNHLFNDNDNIFVLPREYIDKKTVYQYYSYIEDYMNGSKSKEFLKEIYIANFRIDQ